MAAIAPQASLGDMPPGPIKLKLQVYCGDEIAMGPGKADLMDAIAAHGSISAAARAMGMSYRRAWLLVDTMNRCWAEPLVAAVPGGSPRSGAALTALGHEVLARYRALQRQADDAAGAHSWPQLETILRNGPVPPR